MVADASGDSPVRVFAREFLHIRIRLQVRRAVGVAFKCDRRPRDPWSRTKRFFKFVIFPFAISQSEPPAIIVNRDPDVIRILERRSAAIEGGVIEVPLRRSELPNELREIMSIFVVPSPTAFGSKIEL